MSVYNTAETIDSREVEERIEALEELAIQGDNLLDVSDRTELRALRALARDAANYAEDWAYGATLIRDDYFVEYAKQYAEDMELIDDEAVWPATHIDWDAAADELRMDYTSVDFDGVTYWVR